MFILLHKPYGVICQFSEHSLHPTLKQYVAQRGVYPAGRLDTDSEGLVVLTDEGSYQQRIAHPKYKLAKTYWVQVEGQITTDALARLTQGVELNDGLTLPARAVAMPEPVGLWPRHPPIRQRRHIPTSWLALTLYEGRNRQVRRMTAAVGFPTLRLIRYAIGEWTLDGLASGESRVVPPPTFSPLPAKMVNSTSRRISTKTVRRELHKVR